MRPSLILTRGTHCPDSLPVIAIVIVAAVVIRIEIESTCIVRTVLNERTRPVVAVPTCTIETAPRTIASCGQEDTVAVSGVEESAFHAVQARPCAGGVINEFLPFCTGL